MDHLEKILGDVPFQLICHNYNSWAGKNGFPLRSRGSLQDKISRLGLSRIAVGQWIRSTDVRRLLDISKQTLIKWSDAGLLPVVRVGDTRNHWYYVKRRI